jgi:hypothetical protein
MRTSSVSYEQHLLSLFTVHAITFIQVAGEMSGKHTEAVFSHIRQYQAEQGTTIGIQGCIQVTVLIAQLQSAFGTVSPWCPPALALTTGTTAHFIFKEYSGAIALAQ